ncbi:MAG: MFS transporter [Verrucomicrobiota bacterium]|nr:MFS transporter [Verrucomicrobiota bacterium]
MAASDAKPGAKTALGLLLAINLFNYIDRQVLAAVEPEIRDTFFSPNDANAMTQTGLLGTAFLVTYMFSAPALGWLSDRFSRWIIIGTAVLLWSLASGGSGLAATFGVLMLTRVFVGIGEGGYGPAAPTILADLFPLEKRGKILAVFCAAIPVGSALGYVLGGAVAAHLSWRWAFYLVTPPGLLLGALCFFQRDPRAAHGERPEKSRAQWSD